MKNQPIAKKNHTTNASDLWPLWTRSLSHVSCPAPAEEFLQFSKWMQLSEANRKIWEGEKSDGLAAGEHKEWAQKLIDKLGRNAQHCARLRRWWDELISFGNCLGKWKIDPLPVFVRLPPPKPALVPGDMVILSQYRQCEDIYWNSVVLGDVSAAQMPYCVLASAIISDGIADPAVLVALAALRPDQVEVVKNEMFLHLPVQRGVNAVASETLSLNALTALWVTRWLNALPDTSRYLLKDDFESLGEDTLQNTGGKSLSTVAYLVVKKTWMKLGLGEMHAKESLRGAFISHVMRSAPYAVNHRAGRLPSNAMPLTVFHRLNNVAPAPTLALSGSQTKPAIRQSLVQTAVVHAMALATSTEPEPPLNVADLGTESGPQLDDADAQDMADIAESHDMLDWDAVADRFDPQRNALNQHEYMGQIGKMFKVQKAPYAAVYSKVKQDCASLWPTTIQLARFACWRRGMELQDGVKETAGQSVRENSIYQYTLTISQYLSPIVLNTNLLEEDPDEIEAMFEEAAQRIKSVKRRSYFWGRLIDFYRFLTLFGAPAIAFSELDGYVSETQGSTQFTVISEQDFQQFKKQVLQASAGKMHTPAMRWLMAAILGYRCGLRRREVQMLLIKNIHPGKEPIICIRANRYAALKSRRAARRLPLFALLPSDELELLMAYWDARLQLAGTRDALMFCHPETSHIPLASGVLFDAITHSFQALMGDEVPKFRFHHLRHSFANRVFLLLMVADRPGLMQTRLDWMDRLGITELAAVKLRDQLYVQLPHCERHPSGKHAYLVCELMGHLSPETTFQHYLHVIFWLAKQESEVHLHHRLQHLTQDELARVCGMPSTAIFSKPYSQCKGLPLEVMKARVLNTIPRRYFAKQVAPNAITGDLQAILKAAAKEESILGPSQFMVMASNAIHTHNKSLRTSNNEGFERAMERHQRNFSVCRSVLDGIYSQYRLLYARRVAADKASDAFKLPPRTKGHRKEFWDVLRAAHASFLDQGVRAKLILAAKELVHRKGTQSVNLGYQQNYDLIPGVAEGLLAMGISPSLMRLEVVVKGAVALSPRVQAVVKGVQDLGVHVEKILTDSRQNISPDGHVHLRVGHVSQATHVASVGPATMTISAGLCQGLNYAALLVLSAVDQLTSRQTSSTMSPSMVKD